VQSGRLQASATARAQREHTAALDDELCTTLLLLLLLLHPGCQAPV
jgi:hypothetical protein